MSCKHNYHGTQGCLACVYVEGWKNGLEEAANIAEFHSGPSIQLAEKIRALKEKP